MVTVISDKGTTKEPAKNLLRVTVQIGDRRFDEDLAAQAMISPNVEQVNEALATNPGRFAEWAMLETLARTERDEIAAKVTLLDADIKTLEARVYLEVVNAPAVPGVKTPTVDGIKALVQVDTRRLALVERREVMQGAERDADAALGQISVGRKTIEEKRESLLALASNWRKEMDGRLTVNSQAFRPTSRP